MNRRNFLRTAAAAVLGLLPWVKGRGEPVAGVDLAAGEDEQGIIVVVADGISDAEAQLIMDRVNLLYPVYVDLHGEGSGVFRGLDHLVTTGYQDADM